MLANGQRRVLDTARACKFGKMVPSTRATGNTTWLTAKADSFTRTETFTRESGSTIRRTEREPTFIWTVLNTPASGGKTNSTVSVSRHGPMAPAMKETTSMERSMVLVPSSGPIIRCTSVNSTTIIFMARAYTPGQMDASTRVNGEITKCTAAVPLPGPTEDAMSVNTWMIRSTAMESSSGLMVVLTRVTGKLANSTARVSTSQVKELRSMENGKRARESDGSAVVKELAVQETKSDFIIFSSIHI